PSGDASEVILTGTFDDWSCSIHMPKGASGFAQRVCVPWNEKVLYKFIADGSWVTRDDRPTEFDGDGNLNNVLFTPTKPTSTMDHSPTFEAKFSWYGILQTDWRSRCLSAFNSQALR
ncbi:hypothetical protein M405DRAFT_739630, partial [Rhizopogon salebrosus TDB-379]